MSTHQTDGHVWEALFGTTSKSFCKTETKHGEALSLFNCICCCSNTFMFFSLALLYDIYYTIVDLTNSCILNSQRKGFVCVLNEEIILHAFFSSTVDKLHTTRHHCFPTSMCSHHTPSTLGKTRSSTSSEIFSNTQTISHVTCGFFLDAGCTCHTFIVCFLARFQLLNNVIIGYSSDFFNSVTFFFSTSNEAKNTLQGFHWVSCCTHHAHGHIW